MISINHFTDDEMHAWCAGGIDNHTKSELIQLVESLLSRLGESEKQSIAVGLQAGDFQESLDACTTRLADNEVQTDRFVSAIHSLSSYHDRLVVAIDSSQQGVTSGLLSAIQQEIDIINEFAERKNRND